MLINGISGHLLFTIATGLYGLSLIDGAFFGPTRRMLVFLLPALLANAVVVAWRYWAAWPMLPMYMGPVVLPLILGGMALGARHGWAGRTQNGILTLVVIIALVAVLFPKDYYIPFLKSQTAWAHLFFWLGVVGRGCFLVAAIQAMAGLGKKNGGSAFTRSVPWIAWGFAFWTLSMFTGELWSYVGWGTPVVWDDPAITTTMATWFFYVGLLHLHLTGSWTPRGRCAFAAVGGLVVLGLTYVPELGPFRWPLG